MAANDLDFGLSYPFSHSLLAAIGWGLLFFAVHFALRRNARTSLLVGAHPVSHWFLDLPMQRPDLPLWPGGPRVGLSGWNSLPLSIAVELVFLLAGAAIYLQTTRARDRVGSFGLYAMLGLLLFFFLAALVTPPPPSWQPIAWSALGLWIFVPWAAWIDRHRSLVV